MGTNQECKMVLAIESPAGHNFREHSNWTTAITNSITNQFYRALIKAMKDEEFRDDPRAAMNWTYPLLHALPKNSPLRQQVVRMIDALEYVDGDYPQATAEDKRLGRTFRAHYNKVAAEIAAKKYKRTA